MRRLSPALALVCSTLLAALAAPLVAAGAAKAAPQSAAEQRYKVLTFGKPSGSEVCRAIAATETVCNFEYNDRGRGPKLHQALTVDADGLPVKLTITGVDYFKVPVEETFTRDAA